MSAPPRDSVPTWRVTVKNIKDMLLETMQCDEWSADLNVRKQILLYLVDLFIKYHEDFTQTHLPIVLRDSIDLLKPSFEKLRFVVYAQSFLNALYPELKAIGDKRGISLETIRMFWILTQSVISNSQALSWPSDPRKQDSEEDILVKLQSFFSSDTHFNTLDARGIFIRVKHNGSPNLMKAVESSIVSRLEEWIKADPIWSMEKIHPRFRFEFPRPSDVLNMHFLTPILEDACTLLFWFVNMHSRIVHRKQYDLAVAELLAEPTYSAAGP